MSSPADPGRPRPPLRAHVWRVLRMEGTQAGPECRILEPVSARLIRRIPRGRILTAGGPASPAT